LERKEVRHKREEMEEGEARRRYTVSEPVEVALIEPLDGEEAAVVATRCPPSLAAP
jgi:hypothetical protein